MKKPTLRIEEQRPGNIQRDRPYHWVCDDRRWAFQNPIFRRGCCQEGSKRIACELPNAESRSLGRFGEGPNTDKISLSTLMGQMGQLGHPDWEQTGHCPFHWRLPSSLEGEQTAVALPQDPRTATTSTAATPRRWPPPACCSARLRICSAN